MSETNKTAQKQEVSEKELKHVTGGYLRPMYACPNCHNATYSDEPCMHCGWKKGDPVNNPVLAPVGAGNNNRGGGDGPSGPVGIGNPPTMP